MIKKPTLVLRAKRPVAVFVEFESFDYVEDEASMRDEPYTVLQRKIESLMLATGATEQQAEKMILGLL